MRPSLRERELHGQLQHAFQNLPPDKFVFALFTTSKTSNLSTHNVDHVFLRYDDRYSLLIPQT